ncbi:MAG: redox-regulated ATPase YchF [Nanobdellota archaeon]
MIIGLVGKPNVGKSSFFKASTLAEILIANYPFATIKPNEGVGYVKVESVAKDFGKTANPREGWIAGNFRFVPVKVIDVAGLVPGAYKGAGMGNQFLDDIRQADVLIHVIDASGSTNEKGEPVEQGSYNPAEDIKFLEIELDMWYLGIIKRGWEKFAKQIQQTHGKIKDALSKQLSGLGVTDIIAEEVISDLGLDTENVMKWSEDDLKSLATGLRKKTKPTVIAANKADFPKSRENIDKLKEDFPDHIIVPTSAEGELALREAAKHGLIDYVPGENNFEITEKGESKMTDKQKNALDFIKKNVLDKLEEGTGVQKSINSAVFDFLGYIAIFPGGVNKLEDSDGNVLPDCFLMPPGSSALDFAYKLHSDFGDNFIKAVDVRTKMPVGKEHKISHRDVIEIMANK